MIEKPPITRRFVRTKAVQYLYAFHINQQANYQNTLGAIKAAFIPDVFAKDPVDSAQLEKEKEKAIDLFIAWEEGKTPYVSHKADKTIAYEVAAKLWEDCQLKLAQDANVLKSGFQITLDKIRDAYLLILQLIVEWFLIAQQQAQKHQQLVADITYPIELAHNHVLEALQANNPFRRLMQQRHLSWDQHMDVVSRWYNQFIKEAPLFSKLLATNIEDKNYQVFRTILEQVVLKQEDIQHFFSVLDLGWEENKHIVEKLLTDLNIESLSITIQGLAQVGASSATFYNALVENVLEQDRSIEAIIEQYTQNWSIERVVLLDRIIIKLALCEMSYLFGTPIKVIINEYVDIAKKYSTSKSGAFVNGLLDTIAKKL